MYPKENMTQKFYSFCKQRREVTPNSGAGQFKAILPFTQMFSKRIAQLFNLVPFSSTVSHSEAIHERRDWRGKKKHVDSQVLTAQALANSTRLLRRPNPAIPRYEAEWKSGHGKSVSRCDLGKSGVRPKRFETRDLISALLVSFLTKTSF